MFPKVHFSSPDWKHPHRYPKVCPVVDSKSCLVDNQIRDLKQDIVNNWQEGAHIHLCSVSLGEDEKGQALPTPRQDTVGRSTSPDVFHSSHDEARSALE